MNKILYLLIFFPLLLSRLAIADERPKQIQLRHDPFQKPEMLLAARPKHVDKEIDQPNWLNQNSKLNMTLRAGKNSMVNVQGRVIKIDENIDGFKLVKVLERSAIFKNDEQQIILKIDEVDVDY